MVFGLYFRADPAIEERDMSPKRKSAGQKAAQTRKRRATGKKAAAKRKHRSAGKKVAKTPVRNPAAKKAAETRATKKPPQPVHVPPAAPVATPQLPTAIDKTEEPSPAPEASITAAETFRSCKPPGKKRAPARQTTQYRQNPRPTPHEEFEASGVEFLHAISMTHQTPLRHKSQKAIKKSAPVSVN
jgi:hypothetical protein